MNGNVTSLVGETTTPQPTPHTLVMTEKAAATVAHWMHDATTDGDGLARALMTLLRMGARGYHESDSLVTFDTPTLTVGMFRDSKGEVTLHS